MSTAVTRSWPHSQPRALLKLGVRVQATRRIVVWQLALSWLLPHADGVSQLGKYFSQTRVDESSRFTSYKARCAPSLKSSQCTTLHFAILTDVDPYLCKLLEAGSSNIGCLEARCSRRKMSYFGCTVLVFAVVSGFGCFPAGKILLAN